MDQKKMKLKGFFIVITYVAVEFDTDEAMGE